MKKLFFFVVALVSASFTIQAQSHVFYVDNNPGSPVNNAQNNYNSVQAAVNAAQAGDTIYIQPSPNGYGDIQMTKKLTIYGIGHNPELNAGKRANVNNILFRYGNASGSKISGLNIQGIYLDNTTYSNNDVIIFNNQIVTINGNGQTGHADRAIISGNFFYNNGGDAISVGQAQDWVFSHNLVHQESTYWGAHSFSSFNDTTIFDNNIILTRQTGDGSQDIRVFNACNSTQIQNNIFIFTSTSLDNFTNLGSNSALTFKNNLTYSVTTALNPLVGTNNIDDTDPKFTSFNSNNSLNNVSNNYTFQVGSPAIGVGSDGNDLGVMNGSFPFSMRGYPTELPYLRDFVINNNILSAGTNLDINIKADANNN